MDARTEGRHADQEDALKKAVDLVGQLDELLPLRVKERYWLAYAQRIQKKYEDAISCYDWLIGLAPTYDSLKLTDKSSLYYRLRRSYTLWNVFAPCGNCRGGTPE